MYTFITLIKHTKIDKLSEQELRRYLNRSLLTLPLSGDRGDCVMTFDTAHLT